MSLLQLDPGPHARNQWAMAQNNYIHHGTCVAYIKVKWKFRVVRTIMTYM